MVVAPGRRRAVVPLPRRSRAPSRPASASPSAVRSGRRSSATASADGCGRSSPRRRRPGDRLRPRAAAHRRPTRRRSNVRLTSCGADADGAIAGVIVRCRPRGSHHDARATCTAPGRAAGCVRMVDWYQRAAEGRPSPCRFTPSCSSYAREALIVHGRRRGLWLTVRRLLRCRPVRPVRVRSGPRARRDAPHCPATTADPPTKGR